ncbi:hypothetical protein ACHAWC_006962 [Mediolabrus comicus]
MYVGSKVLQSIFGLVAKTQSSETFVELSLLVSVGMGAIAKSLGLTDTAGAFAAGILLANTNFRAQIQADILPFKGILLGIFFMDAGSLFDTELVLSELPTVLTGAFSLILLKAITVDRTTAGTRWLEPNRLDPNDAIKLAFLLSGGGEFAFVVLALAEKLEVLPKDLGGLLTAIVLITMAVTPLLGVVAAAISESFTFDQTIHTSSEEGESFVSEDAIVVCGYGDIGKALVEKLNELKSEEETGNPPRVVAFDNSPILMNSILLPSPSSAVMFGDSSNPEVLIAHGVLHPRAIFVSYDDHEQVMAAVARLRYSFRDAPIFTRAQSRGDAQELMEAGATEVVVEFDELPRSAKALMSKVEEDNVKMKAFA